MRLAILDKDRCRPTKCQLECSRFCPVNRSGSECIFYPHGDSKPPYISEELCTGCGICPKKCPFKAITIINLPEKLDSDLIHRYGDNGFSMFRLPILTKKAVTGLIGQNGIGKSTALKILSGELKPNFGRTDESDPDVTWEEIIDFFRGTESQFFFERIRDKKLKCIRKPQYIENIPKKIKGVVKDVFDKIDERDVQEEIVSDLGLDRIWKREISKLSGGELQKLAIGVALCRDADVYLFDEPSSFLDVRERINMARTIRKLKQEEDKTVIVVEHDLAILDYLSDYVSIFYGEMGGYGIVSHPYGVREGINNYLEGFLPDENMRFRPERIKISKTSIKEKLVKTDVILSYSDLQKGYTSSEFKLTVLKGEIQKSQVIGILGPNGIGKSTFVKMLAGIEKIDKGEITFIEVEEEMDENDSDVGEDKPPKKLTISYKPQYLFQTEGIDPSQSVWNTLYQTNRNLVSSSWFKSEVIRPFNIEMLFNHKLEDISGGELQKVLITLSLAREADLYLFDEPSAYLSIEDRLRAARIISRFIQNTKKSAFIVDHDIVFQDYVSDMLQIFLGRSGFRGKAYAPTALEKGMNRFLSNLSITFRRDPVSGRPRVNKPDSKMDKKQRVEGRYFYTR
ncbi:MAG: ribosome biogenesis/translation initiation ATPase RLI [Candidatus Hodarchaeales archaeon]